MTHGIQAEASRLDIVLPPSPDGSSFDIYRAASAAQARISLPDDARAQDFFVDGATYQLPQAVLTRIRSSAQQVRRGQEEIAQDVVSTVQMTLLVAGHGELKCGDRTEATGPGDITLLNSQCAYDSHISAFDLRILMVPHDRVPPIFLRPDVHCMRLPGDLAGTRLLATLIDQLIQDLERLTAVEVDHAVEAICHLAAGMIQAHLDRLARGRRRWSDPQLDAAMAYIEQRHTDAEFAQDAVGAYLGLSRSALYRLFAPLGGIEAVIRQRRLNHAMQTLLTSTLPTLSLGAFALRHGFRNETHFVRAFKARFGATPLQAHSKITKGDRAWLMMQAGRAGFTSLQALMAALSTSLTEQDVGPGPMPELDGA